MGLVVIVVLLALGMFFLTKFTLLEEKSPVKAASQNKQLASNFLNTLLYANAGCGESGATFRKLIDDIETPDFSLLQCGEGSLDEYFNETVTGLLNETLGTWGDKYNKYELVVQFPTAAQVDDIVISHECDTVNSEPASYPFTGDLGDIIVTLRICY